jgi:FtsZ-interacting cell division protein ZipA
MTYVLIGIAIIVIVAIVIAGKGKQKESRGEYFSVKPLSDPEQAMYWKLKESLGDEYVVLAQVGFSRFIRSRGGDKKANTSLYYKARQKVADFVVCKKDFSIAAVIEIDDKTHNKQKDDERDSILESAGLKVVRWNVKQLPTSEEIQEKIK